MVFRFDEDLGRVELDYPRDMAMWKGVGYNIDSVFQWKDGKRHSTRLLHDNSMVRCKNIYNSTCVHKP